MWVAIDSFVSNQEPRFLAEETAETLQSPTCVEWVLTLANCWGVPITKNSDLSSLSLRLSVNIHERISSTQDYIAFKTESSLITSLGQKEIHNWVSSAKQWTSGRCAWTIWNNLLTGVGCEEKQTRTRSLRNAALQIESSWECTVYRNALRTTRQIRMEPWEDLALDTKGVFLL